jgi:NADPH-dependent 2,4-dienoyl-CoA reductase/sulfur reductase-like enzyme
MEKNYVIIGASAAGIGALRTLRRLDPHSRITCITDQFQKPYNTCLLADYCAGIISEEELFLPHTGIDHERVTILFATRVTAINSAENKIICADGTMVPYTSLLIATGTSPIIPAIDGLDVNNRNIFLFHRLSDIQKILAYIHTIKPRSAAIIGAGLSGLEAADALVARGLQVTIIEREHQVLPGLIDVQMANFIHHAAHRNGINILYGTSVTALKNNATIATTTLHLANERQLEVDLVIIATGSKPNSQLAYQAGVEVRDGAIQTNACLQTSVRGMYAAGDVAWVTNALTGERMRTTTWPEAMAQGVIAAHGMAGIHRAYPGVIPYVSSSFFGCKFAVCGQTTGECDAVVSQASHWYKRITRNAEGICGFSMVGPTVQEAAEYKRLIALRSRKP